MKIAEAFVQIRADNTQYKKDLKETENTTLASARTITGQIAQVFGAAAFTMGLRRAINSASDLNEEVSKSNVIFGEAAVRVQEMAKTAAQSMGQSERAYLAATANLKGLLENMGLGAEESVDWSMKLTQLGSDLASFFNTDPADAVYAIGAALRGESEPLRRYNVQLSDVTLKAKAMELGLYSGKGALDMTTKAQAALALIMEQTTAAQGDFTRTADGVANSTRITAAETENAAASMGQNFLPIYQRAVTVVGDLARIFGALPGPIQTTVIVLLGLVALAGPVMSAVQSVKALTVAINALGTTTKTSLGVIGALIAVAGILFTIFSDDGEESTTDVADATNDFAASLKQSTTELLANVDAITALRGALPGTTVGMNTLSDAIVGAFEATGAGRGNEVVTALGKMGLTAQDAATVFDVLTSSIQEGTYRQNELAQTVFGLTDEQVRFAQAAASSGKTYDEMIQTYVDGGMSAEDATAQFSKELFAQASAIATVEEEGGALRTTMLEWYGDNKDAIPDVQAMSRGFLDQATGASELTASLVQQATAQAEANGQGDDAMAIYLEYIALAAALGDEQLALALDLDKAAASGASATDSTEQQAAAAEAAKRANDDLSRTLDDTRTSFDEAAEAADALRDAIDRVFGNTMGLEEAGRELQSTIDDLTTSIDENGATLDINTEKGRTNREAIQSQVEAILDYGTAMVGAGRTTDEASAAVAAMTESLKEQLRQAGFTEDEINDYLTTLGLTPENVTTSIELANTEQAKTRLDDILTRVGDLEENDAITLQTLIDEGKYAEAERLLTYVARERNIKLGLSPSGRPLNLLATQGTGGGLLRVYWQARGSYIDQPMIMGAGEDGPEAVLPLSKPSRLAELLRDDRISAPVMEALASNMSSGGSVGMSSLGASQASGDTFVLVGWSESMMRDLESRLDARKRGRR